MDLINRLIGKLERTSYSLLDFFVCRDVSLRELLDQRRKYFFLYFDYEREHSGHISHLCDENIYAILNLLAEAGITSTWFTVGKVLEEHPDTIEAIKSFGNEIASHTYGHISLRRCTTKKMAEDFSVYAKLVGGYGAIKGFHSPKDQWDVRAIRFYKRHGYQYDILKTAVSSNPATYVFRRSLMDSFIRLSSIRDDWYLYENKLSSIEVCEYYHAALDLVQPGCIAGLGFHPWILASDKKIMDGFKALIESLMYQGDLSFFTCAQYADMISNGRL